jgi:hypothetical protein
MRPPAWLGRTRCVLLALGSCLGTRSVTRSCLVRATSGRQMIFNAQSPVYQLAARFKISAGDGAAHLHRQDAQMRRCGLSVVQVDRAALCSLAGHSPGSEVNLGLTEQLCGKRCGGREST